MNRVSGRLVVGSLSILFLVSLVLLVLQTLRVGKLEDRADVWAEYKARLDGRVEAAEEQSLFFLEKLVELDRSDQETRRSQVLSSKLEEVVQRIGEIEKRLAAAEKSDEEESTALRDLVKKRLEELSASTAAATSEISSLRDQMASLEASSSKLQEVVQQIGEIEKRLAAAEKSDEEESTALRDLVKKRLEELSASTAAATSEISSLRDQVATVAAARERVDARLADLAQKIEGENGPSSPIDELQTLEDLVNGVTEKLEKQREELTLLRKRSEEAASSRKEIASTVEEIRRDLGRSPPGEPGKERLPAGTEKAGDGAGPATGGDGPTTTAAGSAEVLASETSRLPVIFVDGARGRVVLEGGEDEGIRPGQIFAIHRAGRRIGRIRIYGTGDGMAAGTIISLVSGESVKKDDTARLVASPSAPSGDEAPRLELRDVPPPPGTDEDS